MILLCYLNSDKPTLHPSFTLDQAYKCQCYSNDAIKPFWGEQCCLNSDKPTLQPPFTLDKAYKCQCYCHDAIKLLGRKLWLETTVPLLLILWWLRWGWYGCSWYAKRQLLKWLIFVADSANPWTVPKVDLHLLYGNYAEWNHCCEGIGTSVGKQLRAPFLCKRMESNAR